MAVRKYALKHTFSTYCVNCYGYNCKLFAISQELFVIDSKEDLLTTDDVSSRMNFTAVMVIILRGMKAKSFIGGLLQSAHHVVRTNALLMNLRELASVFLGFSF